MATEWGAWEYNSGNGMRVGLDVTTSAVSHSSTSVTFTVKVYTENQYTYDDDQVLNYGGSLSGSTSFHNGAGGSVVLRATKTYTYNYGSTEYGSSPGNRTFTASLSGAYNGVTPSKSRTEAIPARPIGPPATPSGLWGARINDSEIDVHWTNNSTAGEPYEALCVERWDNVGASWSQIAVLWSSTAQDYANTGLSANRQYQHRVRAYNGAGYSAYVGNTVIQTTPADPASAAVAKETNTSVTITWTNGATGSNYDYTTDLEESVNGGAYSVVANLAEGVASATRSSLSPGSVYQYRVRTKSTTGATTYSAYSTTSTIQLQSPPAAPTSFSVTRNSDTSYSLSWTDNPTTDAPYDGITVQRWDNVSNAWVTVANLPGTATNVTDTGTVVDRKYKWQIAATNSAGASAYVVSGYFWTTPDAPSSLNAVYTGGTSIQVSWTSNVSYSEYSHTVRWYKNNVLQSGPQSIAAGNTSYTLTGADVTATYKFEIQAVATTGGWTSAWVMSNEVMGAAPPNAPTTLAPDAEVRDLARANTFTWVHSPSQDGSAQNKYEVQHRVSGGSWTSTGTITSTSSSYVLPAGTYANGQAIEWQVRTWGVHASAGPWSSTATITGSTTPTVSLVTPGTNLSVSAIAVDWDYYDAESTAQSQWEVNLYDSTGATLLESKTGSTTATAVTLDTAAIDGSAYRVTVRVCDGSGLWSDLFTRNFTSNFVPPAESLLTASYDPDSGVTVLTLNPTADDGGVTTLPASSATIERQIYDPETETYGPWEVVIANVAPNATIIDTTSPIHEDGYYRVTTYSNAPSLKVATTYTYPSQWGMDWVYVSGGPNFDVVCRMFGNIELGWKASRDKALYHFAGRSMPVMYSGEATEKTLTVSGLATSDASQPAQWLRLAQQKGPVLLRAPGKRRIYGSLSEVSVDRIYDGLHKVSFSIQEVYRQ